MSEEVKFTEPELKEVNSLQGTYVNLQSALGQLQISRIRLEQQINDLNDSEGKVRAQFTDTQNQEREFVQSINKKYGENTNWEIMS